MSLLAIAFSALAESASPAASPADDEVLALVRRARGGDREAACTIYRAYVARIFRTVRPLCVSDAEAEDVTQEAFARAFEALDRYEARAGARFVSWLLTIALNVARKSHRRRKRTRPEDPARLAERLVEVEAEVEADGPQAHDRRVLRAALLDALAGLPERERTVVTLRYGGELDAKEIAELLGLSHANVRKIAQRTRAQLEKSIRRSLRPDHPLLEEDRP